MQLQAGGSAKNPSNRLAMTLSVWADPSTHPAVQLGYAKLRTLLQGRPQANMRCKSCLGVDDGALPDQYEVYRYTDLQSGRSVVLP